MTVTEFQDIIWQFARANMRSMPWRSKPEPYYVLVSEIMLQQTQVDRVVPKFNQFINVFPSIEVLAKAPLSRVLVLWSGLGYNRRAVALHTIAKKVVTEYNGKLPKDAETFRTFPHIGPNTAGSVLAFAYNLPTIFIETNIRTVFIHFYFKDQKDVHDKDILKLVEKTIDHNNPREWYYALMDYGAHLKQTIGNLSRQSVHYTKQKPFKGSNRETRSRILDAIRTKPQTLIQLKKIVTEKEILLKNLKDLQKEGFIKKTKNTFKIQ